MVPLRPNRCAFCDSPLAHDQHYCLSCGERCGPPRLDPLHFARGRPGDAIGAAAILPSAALPGPRVAALLAAIVLGTGTLIGAVAGSEAPAARAAVAGKRIVLLAPPPAAPVAPAPPAVPAADVPVVDPPAEAPAPPAELPTAAPEAAASIPDAPPVAPTEEESADTLEVTPAPTVPAGPPISHVWVLSLSGHGHADAFGPAASDPWFREVLSREGVLLNNVHAVSPGSLGSGLALLAGAPRRPATDADCPDLAQGCTVAAADGSLLEQLDATGRTWKAYVEPTPGSPPPSCTPAPGPVAARNPVAFLEGVTRDRSCATRVVGLETLTADLTDAATTPTFSLIVPNACHDGRDTPCAPGAPAGLAAAAAPTRATLDAIRGSAAYAEGGLVIVLFDHGVPGDTSARKGTTGPAGGAVGAVLLSPFVTPGRQVAAAYDQFSMLKTIEERLALPLLGGAAERGVKAFGPRVFDIATEPTG